MATSIRELLVSTLADVAGDVVKSYATRHTTPSSPTVTVKQVTPSPPGCPYCAVAKELAITAMYMRRVLSRKEIADIYRDLAASAFDAAISKSYHLPATDDAETFRRFLHTVPAQEIWQPDRTTIMLTSLERLEDAALDYAEKGGLGENAD